jgi:hypothetical protein
MTDEGNFDNGPCGGGTGNPPAATLSMGSGRLRVKLELRHQGRDFLLLVAGGEAHVGAVAVFDGRDGGSRAVVTEMPGHREGPLAGECAEILGRATGRTVVAVAGIHQDDATGEEISAIVANVRQGAGELAKTIATNLRASDD